MKIGILGFGNVGKTLAAGFHKHGNKVMLSTRDTAKLVDWKKENPEILTGNYDEAAKFGDMLVLAVKGTGAEAALQSIKSAHLAGKVIMDTTNPIADAPPVNGVLKFYTSLDDSLMERLQKKYPEAKFVKAFSSVGAASMVNPNYKEGKPTMFICGNDQDARKQVSQILDQFGWETADMDGVEAARAIEPLCILWCIPGFMNNQWSHAFKLLK